MAVKQEVFGSGVNPPKNKGNFAGLLPLANWTCNKKVDKKISH